MGRKNNKNKHEDIKMNMVESLHLPKDYVLGSAIVTITGQNEAYIENYRGILEYSKESILIQTKTCLINISGECLVIDYYTNEEMKIKGIICQVSYC